MKARKKKTGTRLVDALKIDKTKFSIAGLGDNSEERRYWHSRTPHERLIAVEIMRRIVYGDERCAAPIQKVLKITPLEDEEI